MLDDAQAIDRVTGRRAARATNALTGSFVYASNLDKATPPLPQAGGRSRFDLSVGYRIPISKRLEYYLDERFYVFYEKNALQSRTTDYFATGVELYVDEARENAFEIGIGYATGAVPPAYVSDNTVAAGFGARFN